MTTTANTTTTAVTSEDEEEEECSSTASELTVVPTVGPVLPVLGGGKEGHYKLYSINLFHYYKL